MKRIILLAGKTASGKDTLAKQLESVGYERALLSTTRLPREGERFGVDYNFMTFEDFRDCVKADNMLDWTHYDKWQSGKVKRVHYGIRESAFLPDKKYVVVCNESSLATLKAHFGEEAISIYLEASDALRKKRVILRGDYVESEWDRRLVSENHKHSEIKVDYVVDVENNLYSNVFAVLKLIREEEEI